MLTDWLIVRRVAVELHASLRGRRVREAGLLGDGRFALGAGSDVVAFDLFGPTPSVTLEARGEPEGAPGWVRTFADALVGLRVERVQSRRGDRLIAFDLATRSRFGVQSGYRLVAELVPRFGNLVLLKGETVVAAAKEFEAGGGTLRTIGAGEPYVPPPLPATSDGEARALDRTLAALPGETVETQRRLLAGALRAEVPALSRLLAESLAIEATVDPALLASADALRERAQGQLADAERAASDAGGEALAYFEATRLVQAHVVALRQFAGLERRREPALLPLLSRALANDAARRATGELTRKRAALGARVAKRQAALVRERALLEGERDDALGPQQLRLAGEHLWAHLHDVPSGAAEFTVPGEPPLRIELDPSLDAKGNAQAFFKRYKKALAKRRHLERRLDAIVLDERFAQDLAWEIERGEALLPDLIESLERLEGRRARRPSPRAGRRGALEVQLAADARVLVGRSPQGNAELTFRLARPDDLWFHARETPGAHVVLRIDSAREATPAELEAAARLAALHSRARDSDKVAVDYTRRKHVRRQAGAAPGLVWYTNAGTLVVAPRSEGTGA